MIIESVSLPKPDLTRLRVLSPVQQEALKRQGYPIVVELTGLSINELRRMGCEISPRYELPFEAQPSRASQVALNPDSPLLPFSTNLNLEEQFSRVRDFYAGLKAEVPGIDVIIGQAADYAELFLRYAEAGNGLNLPGWVYARTQTLVGLDSVNVGFDPTRGVTIDTWIAHGEGHDLAVFPLIVPSVER